MEVALSTTSFDGKSDFEPPWHRFGCILGYTHYQWETFDPHQLVKGNEMNTVVRSWKFLWLCVIPFVMTSCFDDGNNDVKSESSVVGTWAYPKPGVIDSSLRSFKLSFDQERKMTFLFYLDKSLADSTAGSWSFDRDTVFISLNDSMDYVLDTAAMHMDIKAPLSERPVPPPPVKTIKLVFKGELLNDSPNGYDFVRK